MVDQAARGCQCAKERGSFQNRSSTVRFLTFTGTNVYKTGKENLVKRQGKSYMKNLAGSAALTTVKMSTTAFDARLEDADVDELMTAAADHSN